nr:hypothetical protein [Thermococcus gammatolerans]
MLSSRIRILGFLARALARPILCLCPSERFLESSVEMKSFCLSHAAALVSALLWLALGFYT